MPNGRPGDHPLTDILHYGSSCYPDDIDELVKVLASLPRFSEFEDRIATILWDNWPHWQNVTPDFEYVRCQLREIQQECVA